MGVPAAAGRARRSWPKEEAGEGRTLLPPHPTRGNGPRVCWVQAPHHLPPWTAALGAGCSWLPRAERGVQGQLAAAFHGGKTTVRTPWQFLSRALKGLSHTINTTGKVWTVENGSTETLVLGAAGGPGSFLLELLQAPAPHRATCREAATPSPTPPRAEPGVPTVGPAPPVLRPATRPRPHTAAPLSALSYHCSPRPAGCTLGPDFTCRLASLHGHVTLLLPPPSSSHRPSPLQHVLHCLLQSLFSSLIPKPSLAPMSEDSLARSEQPAMSSSGQRPPPAPCSPASCLAPGMENTLINEVSTA